LQKTVDTEMQASRNCAKQLKEAQAFAKDPRKECAAHRHQDGEKMVGLTKANQALSFQLERTKVNCDVRQREAEIRHLAAQLNESRAAETNATSQLATMLGEKRTSVNVSVQQAKAMVQQLEDMNDTLQSVKEQRDDEAEVAEELKSAGDSLRRSNDADQATISTLSRELNSTTHDKEHLLETVREFMVENSKLQAQLAQAEDSPLQAQHEDTPVHKLAHPVAKVPKARQSVAASHRKPNGKHEQKRTSDPVAWMGTTDKIDGYLSNLAPDQLPDISVVPDVAPDAVESGAAQQQATLQAPPRRLRSGKN